MEFKIGDKVAVLDDTIEGRVVAIEDNMVAIEDAEGFPLKYDASQLVKLGDSIKVTNHEVARVKTEKELPKKKQNKAPKKKERNAPKMEVDLHIHQLTQSTRGMGNYDILNLQLETAKRQLEFAIKKRIQKVVFIHGVGEGILKEELNTFSINTKTSNFTTLNIKNMAWVQLRFIYFRILISWAML